MVIVTLGTRAGSTVFAVPSSGKKTAAVDGKREKLPPICCGRGWNREAAAVLPPRAEELLPLSNCHPKQLLGTLVPGVGPAGNPINARWQRANHTVTHIRSGKLISYYDSSELGVSKVSCKLPLAVVHHRRLMRAAGSSGRYVPWPTPLSAAPIGLQWQTVASRSRNRLNLRTQQVLLYKKLLPHNQIAAVEAWVALFR
ncbi:hypothetical protein UY3_09852 [Chelonia mydas]|uniref:Uncharacterized protein n=1 Tax=Chelonia mydas TaxID=8469 RepID=M7B505_CHEMY|nr:hypothetical protein UY3_09852 [Chelonia mydas]